VNNRSSLKYEGCPETSHTFEITCQHDRAVFSVKLRILAVTFVSHVTPVTSFYPV